MGGKSEGKKERKGCLDIRRDMYNHYSTLASCSFVFCRPSFFDGKERRRRTKDAAGGGGVGREQERRDMSTPAYWFCASIQSCMLRGRSLEYFVLESKFSLWVGAGKDKGRKECCRIGILYG